MAMVTVTVKGTVTSMVTVVVTVKVTVTVTVVRVEFLFWILLTVICVWATAR